MRTIKYHVLTGHQASLITKIERFQGAFEAMKFREPSLIESLKKTSIITSSGASTRIEGAVLTDKQVEELVNKDCQITRISSRSEREVAGYVEALRYIYDHYEELDISEKNIREIHQLLTRQLTEDQFPKKQRGTYKDITNDVVEANQVTGEIIKVWFKTTPPGPATQTAMRNLIENYSSLKESEACHPLVLIGGFIVHFLAIHPFRDGNGRLSRLLTTLLLMKHGYKWAQYTSHEKVIEDNKEQYYVGLRSTQATFENETPQYEKWVNFFLKVVSLQTDFLGSKIARGSPVSVMNQNEKNIYQIIETTEGCKISYLLEQTKMTRSGLKSLLKRLVEKGLVEKQGKGRGTIYSPVRWNE